MSVIPASYIDRRPHFLNKIDFFDYFPNYILINCLRILYLVNNVMSDVNPISLTCPFCDTLVVNKSALHCDKCDHWVYYKLPLMQLFNFKISCVDEQFKDEFPELHTEIEGIIFKK